MSDEFSYAFLPLSGPAARIAEGVWELRAPAETEIERIAPDGSCEAIFHLASPPEEARGGEFRRQPEALFYGPLTRALTLRREGALHIRAVRFRPWGAAALARGLAGLRDRGAPVREAFGTSGARLEDAARAAPSLEAFARRAQGLLGDVLRGAEDPGRDGFASFARDLAVRPAASVAALEGRSGWSGRTLNRLFMARMGLSAGEYLRILRFQRAREAVKAGAGPLSWIADEAGYADQAHMTRDFVRLAGESPGAVRRAAALFDPLYGDAGGADPGV